MSHSSIVVAPRARLVSVAFAAAALVALAGAPAQAQNGSARASHAQKIPSGASRDPAQRCVPANGAQIMGGFAGADDRFDTVTGEICRK